MMHSIPRSFRSFLPFILVVFTGTACGPVEMTTVVDTQFLLGNRALPLRNLIVVFDGSDFDIKQRFEAAFVKYLAENAELRAFRDVDLYTPLKQMTDKEKLWALKDESIDGILYIDGGGSGRSLREWLYPEAPDIETTTIAWKSGTVRLFLPQTGQVIWVGNVTGHSGTVGEDLMSRRFYGAVTSDLILHGILQQRRPQNPAMPGFNR
ncbi:MAG: hypothetical protein JXA28_09190 [Bacteroidetes bacterium]|nr:hypothetical protein [Bacteroidota bacterium]